MPDRCPFHALEREAYAMILLTSQIMPLSVADEDPSRHNTLHVVRPPLDLRNLKTASHYVCRLLSALRRTFGTIH